MTPKYFQILFAFLMCNTDGISGLCTRSQHSVSLSRLRSARGEISESDTGRGATLELKGEIEVTSSPLPSLPEDKMMSFFANPVHRNLLVTAGGKRACEELFVSADLFEDWEMACDLVGAQPPDESDIVLSVRTGGIDFPGLHLTSKAKIGLKLVQEPSPRYEFVLIGDEQTITGLPPVVWIYNKLTGSQDNDEKSRSTSTSSLSVVSYDKINDGKTIFTSKSSLSIIVNFPVILLKILPTNKERAEETGGKALRKTLQKDVETSMAALEKIYLKYSVEESGAP